MNTVLTFIIPVCHPANCKDWPLLKRHLAQTMASVSSQVCDDWNAVIIANDGADLPELPPRFRVCRVSFDPNLNYEQGLTDEERFRKSVRQDKGRRILAGMLAAGEMGHAMVVDADDFVSNRLACIVAANKDQFGWYVSKGYAFQEGSRILALCKNFNKLCGTSHIVRADLFELPPSFEFATDAYIQNMLGSHIFIQEHLTRNGTPLSPLPFTGAIYRVGHALSHSQSKGIFRTFFGTSSALRYPHRLLKNLLRARVLTRKIRKEFFGSSSRPPVFHQ